MFGSFLFLRFQAIVKTAFFFLLLVSSASSVFANGGMSGSGRAGDAFSGTDRFRRLDIKRAPAHQLSNPFLYTILQPAKSIGLLSYDGYSTLDIAVSAIDYSRLLIIDCAPSSAHENCPGYVRNTTFAAFQKLGARSISPVAVLRFRVSFDYGEKLMQAGEYNLPSVITSD